MKWNFFTPCCAVALLAIAFPLASSNADTCVTNFDLVDDFLKVGSNYSGAGSYDVFSNSSATGLGSDGIADIFVNVTQGGMGSDGNNVSWSGSDDTTGTGLRSTINPTFEAGGGVTSNNGGHTAWQCIEINFGSQITITADDITDFGWSSGNTAGIAWEYSELQYLDVNGNAFSASSGVLDPFLSHTPIDGYTGIGTFLADGTGNVLDVGTNLTAAGSSGSNNGVSTDPLASGIATGTQIGGLRFCHYLQDVRGINNGDTVFTNTINDLDLAKVIVAVPEPSSGLTLATIGLACFMKRRKR